MATALFIGRFQPFHNAHLTDIKKILKKHKNKLVIVIGSSKEKNTERNPYSYKARKEMITRVLKANKISNFSIIPIPDMYSDKKWVKLIEKKATFDVLYTGNPWTIRCFKKYGKHVKRIKLIKGINSTIIRSRMKQGKDWKSLVPKEVYTYLLKMKN